MNESLTASSPLSKRLGSLLSLGSPARRALVLSYRFALGVAAATALAPGAQAQTPAPAAPPATTVAPAAAVTVAPPAASVEVVAPAPEPMPPPPPESVAPVPVVDASVPAPEAPVVPDAPISTEEKLPSLDVGVWMRVGATLHNPLKPKKIDDLSVGAYGEVHFSGKVHKMVSYTLNLNASGMVGGRGDIGAMSSPGDAVDVAARGRFGIMDAIIGLDFHDLFHIWGGQLLVASDRSNFSGPFFMIPWNYPGLAGGAAGPKEGPYGRNEGVVAWGDAMKGKFKYYLGAYGLGDPSKRPFYSGRLNLAIIGAEPGFYHNSTYYGDQNILAVGLGGQYQNDAVPVSDAMGNVVKLNDYGLVNGDVLAEFKLGESVVTAEGAVYGFPAKNTYYQNSFMLLGAFLTPMTPLGKLHPTVRYQGANAAGFNKDWILDASVGAVIKGFNLRGVLGFQHADLGNATSNSAHIGIQTIEF